MSIRIEIAKTNAKKLLNLSQELIQMFQQKKIPTAFSAKDKNLPDTKVERKADSELSVVNVQYLFKIFKDISKDYFI